MATSRRLMKELDDIRKSGPRCFQAVKANDTNVLLWQGLLVPDHQPYDRGAFTIEISFPADYPFKPPKVTFKTQIYHPNVDEKGQVCLPIISPDHWKPATKTIQVIQSLITMIRTPELEHPLRADLAEEYSRDHRKYLKNAEEHTCKFSEKRPVD